MALSWTVSAQKGQGFTWRGTPVKDGIAPIGCSEYSTRASRYGDQFSGGEGSQNHTLPVGSQDGTCISATRLHAIEPSPIFTPLPMDFASGRYVKSPPPTFGRHHRFLLGRRASPPRVTPHRGDRTEPTQIRLIGVCCRSQGRQKEGGGRGIGLSSSLRL